MSPDTSPRYRQLADDLTEAISTGLLGPGERLPSVRETCRSLSVSPSTVFQAYGLLETRGCIEARPRSGYFVSRTRRVAQGTPEAAPARAEAAPVALSEGAFGLLAAAGDPRWVPLGSAFPAAQLFPLAELSRCGSRAMRRMKPEQVAGALLAGDEGLRSSLRRRYALTGVPLTADEPLITNGAMEALNLCLQAVTRPDRSRKQACSIPSRGYCWCCGCSISWCFTWPVA